MDPLVLTGLSTLMAHTSGDPGIVIGLIDGPVAEEHPDLTREHLRAVRGRNSRCKDPGSSSCKHGTFIAGMLNAKRSSRTPGICPACTLLVRPVFSEHASQNLEIPGATPMELAWALIDCIDHGACIVNMSIALEERSPEGDAKLIEALDYAAEEEVIVAAAAGNQGIIGGTALTRHPWVLPVAACDARGRFAPYSNITGSIRRNGLMAPGDRVTGLATHGPSVRFCGTSTAVPFVTGTLALLWSECPSLSASDLLTVLADPYKPARRGGPPLLNAWRAYQTIRQNGKGKKAA